MMNTPYAQTSAAAKVVTTLLDYWTRSNTARKDVDAVHDAVIRSYNAKLPQHVLDSKAIQTKTHLGWTAKAVDAFTAKLAPLLMPGADKYCSLYDTSKTYALASAVMYSMLVYFMQTAGIVEVTKRMCDTLALQGAIGLQPRWDYFMGPDALPDLDIQLINPTDFGVYPVSESLKRAVRMLRTYMTKNEMLEMATKDETGSFDIDAINSIQESTAYTRPVPTSSTNRTASYNERLGLEVIDFYIPAIVIEDQWYYHARATVVNKTTLIRFVSATDPYRSVDPGAILAFLNELYVEHVGPVRVGVGLCNKAIDIEMAAITVNNLGIDNIKDTVKPPRTYDPKDKYWNNNRSSFAPGELIPTTSGQPYHLKPMDASQRAVPQAEEMISRLMYQYESSVGIPNFLSGTSDTDDRRVSATAKRLEADGADTGLRDHGQTINNSAIRPLTISVYEMIRAEMLREMGEIAAIAKQTLAMGQPVAPDAIMQLVQTKPFLAQAAAICSDFQAWIASGQSIPPMSAISLSLSTFEDALKKVDQINNSERAIATLGQLATASPDVAQVVTAEIDMNTFVRNYLESLDLGNSLRPISQVEQAMQQAQQEQVAQKQKNDAIQLAQLQLEAQKMQAEIAKIQADTDKANAEVQKVQAETLQTIHETNNPEEPKDESTSGTKTGSETISK